MKIISTEARKVFHGKMPHPTKAGPGRAPLNRRSHNPPGTKLARRMGRGR